jgi:hypothetical protein
LALDLRKNRYSSIQIASQAQQPHFFRFYIFGILILSVIPSATSKGHPAMSTEHPSHAEPSQQADAATPQELASMDNFVRLQQSQLEFMAWLDATEKTAEIDRYTYRKIR